MENWTAWRKSLSEFKTPHWSWETDAYPVIDSSVTERHHSNMSMEQEAQSILKHECVIRLSRKDVRKILSLLKSPPRPTKTLKAAVRDYRSFVSA